MAEWTLSIFLKDIKWYNALHKNKTVESRVPDLSNPAKDYTKIKAGDKIVIQVLDSNTLNRLDYPLARFIVKFNHHYPTVESMLKVEGLANVFPGVRSLKEAEDIICSFPRYAKDLKKNGICAFGLRKA
ncbi:hypothetical protein HOD83_03520 [Candidatus Woesearchaeota archaeon]|jgi:ASC-1-like (ASCH) protein|nr:hypothetical protein [Candidatus Woesearchaeota archaeon]MBT4114335.1 hypothetical protein [Candidatus Woesearchaeota archaeon]MBT4248624.1 hypothetical protein [Candidatus Woesearchaeota archaeon]